MLLLPKSPPLRTAAPLPRWWVRCNSTSLWPPATRPQLGKAQRRNRRKVEGKRKVPEGLFFLLMKLLGFLLLLLPHLLLELLKFLLLCLQ